jgi:hypothetical protein
MFFTVIESAKCLYVFWEGSMVSKNFLFRQSILATLIIGGCNKSEKSNKSDGPTISDPSGKETSASDTEESDEGSDNSDGSNETNAETDPNVIPVTGTLALTGLGLAQTSAVTHVVAVDTESGKTAFAEVQEDGTFTLGIRKNRPWVVSYVDATKTGADMIISSFASGTLDTLSPGVDTDAIDMGTVDSSSPKATMDLSASGLLSSMGMTANAAETVGAIDDVSLRYSNPDIDNNGTIDAVENKVYLIDFHNRFTAQKVGGGQYNMNDMKNAFYPDNTQFQYTGTGIFPQISKADFAGTAPATYDWSFSVDVPVAGNGGQICSGKSPGDTLTAGTDCSLSYQSNVGANSNAFTFGMETADLKAGDYALNVGGKTYFWKNVAVSDFSAGDGFLALFIRVDVDTITDKVTGISYKWQKKGADNSYALATEEEINLIVKSSDEAGKYGGYASLKYQGDESKGSLGVSIPKKPSGSISFADLQTGDTGVYVGGTVLTREMVKAGIPFTDLTTNPGISYDDKLGMRFFF